MSRRRVRGERERKKEDRFKWFRYFPASQLVTSQVVHQKLDLALIRGGHLQVGIKNPSLIIEEGQFKH